jgi:hypothetical protein
MPRYFVSTIVAELKAVVYDNGSTIYTHKRKAVTPVQVQQLLDNARNQGNAYGNRLITGDFENDPNETPNRSYTGVDQNKQDWRSTYSQ